MKPTLYKVLDENPNGAEPLYVAGPFKSNGDAQAYIDSHPEASADLYIFVTYDSAPNNK